MSRVRTDRVKYTVAAMSRTAATSKYMLCLGDEPLVHVLQIVVNLSLEAGQILVVSRSHGGSGSQVQVTLDHQQHSAESDAKSDERRRHG